MPFTPVRTVPIHAIVTGPDTSRPTDADIASLVAAANLVWEEQGIKFTFNPRSDLERIDDYLYNEDFPGFVPPNPQLMTNPNIRAQQEYSAAHRGKLVIFFRHYADSAGQPKYRRPNGKPTEMHFSGLEWEYVRLDKSVPGLTVAHEIGHYFDLLHTFAFELAAQPGKTIMQQVKEAIYKYVVKEGHAPERGLDVFDGDRNTVGDTPPDVGRAVFDEVGLKPCDPASQIRFNLDLPSGKHQYVLKTDPANIMNYFGCASLRYHLSPQQGARARRRLHGRRRHLIGSPISGSPHICAINTSGGLYHAIRSVKGTWSGFGDVQEQTRKAGGSIGPTPRAACATDPSGNLHVTAINRENGLYHAVRYADGRWSGFGDVQEQTRKAGGSIGPTPTVACASDTEGNLHVFAINISGGLYHAIRYADGRWSGFGDVQEQTRKAGGSIGPTPKVACAVDNANNLHLCATSNQEGLYHAMRLSDGTWTAFGDVQEQTRKVGGSIGPTPMVACATDLFSNLHICAINKDDGLYHAMRLSDGTWTGFGAVQEQTEKVSGSIGFTPTVACATDFGSNLHICAINKDNGLYHAVRYADGRWSGFGAVQEQTAKAGGSIGPTPTVSCSADVAGKP